MMTLSAHRHSPADLARIQARILVFIGDEDMPAFVRNAELLRDNVADCQVVTLPRSGHLPLLERPEAVAADLAAHLLRAG